MNMAVDKNRKPDEAGRKEHKILPSEEPAGRLDRRIVWHSVGERNWCRKERIVLCIKSFNLNILDPRRE